jgi:hypothetical protein
MTEPLLAALASPGRRDEHAKLGVSVTLSAIAELPREVTLRACDGNYKSGGAPIRHGGRTCGRRAQGLQFQRRSVAAPLLARHRASVVPCYSGRDGAAVFARSNPDPTGSNADCDIASVSIIAIAISIASDLHFGLRHLKPRCAHGRGVDRRRSGQAENRRRYGSECNRLHGRIPFPPKEQTITNRHAAGKFPRPRALPRKVLGLERGRPSPISNRAAAPADAPRSRALAPSLQPASAPC